MTDFANGAGKTCRQCGRENLPPEEFYARQGRTCKQCIKDGSSEWRKANPLRYRATRSAWEKDNAELARNRRLARIKRRYQISKEALEEWLTRQDFKCAICKVKLQSPLDLKPKKNRTKPVVDHDHRDGHVRGILCSACNVGLGLLEDDLDIIKAAYRYLKNDQANSALR